MSTALEIPLSPNPQYFQISIGNTNYNYNLNLWWNNITGCWVLDIADEESNPILYGIPLVTGADLLEQYDYLGFGGQLIAQTDFDITAPPTFSNLGDTGHLYFVTTP